MGRPNYSHLFAILDQTLQNFIQEVNNQQLQNMVTDEWSVNDELCHIVFWHRYYAQHYSALAKGEKPFVFTSKGGSTRNKDGVDSLKTISKDELMRLLHMAQRELYESIVVKNVSAMNYTDRRRYTTEQFLDIVIGHIKRHTKHIMKAKKLDRVS